MLTENAEKYRSRLFAAGADCEAKAGGGFAGQLEKTDPEFAERLENFMFDEVPQNDDLDDRTRNMAVLAALIGCQGIDLFREMVPAAFNMGVSPVEIKEIVYQAVDYCGFGRVFPFIKAADEELKKLGIKLPLEPQATTTMENRLEAGAQAQVDIFGPGMKEFYKSGPEETVHINRWLAANCFGDYYTRKGLDL